MSRKTHEQLVKVALNRPSVKRNYDALEGEFNLLRDMVKARNKAGKTQSEIASAMKTSTSTIGRLETGGGKQHHSPTIETLRKYAKAIGCELKIKFVQHK